MEGFPISSAKGLVFFCSVKLFSAVAGPIGAKFGMMHEPDASQVLRDFGATPGTAILAPFAIQNFAKNCE